MKAWTHSFAALTVALTAGPALADFDGPAPVAWRWAQTTTASPSGAPIIYGDNVIVASGGRVYSVEKASGNQVWRFPAAEPLEGNFRNGATMGNGMVVAAADNKNVYAVDAKTGALKWQYLAPGSIVGAPRVVGSHVMVSLSPSGLMSVNADTGAAEWAEPMKLEGNIYPNTDVFGENLIVCTNAPAIISVNPAARKAVWTIHAGALSGNGAPVVYGDNIYVNSGYYLTVLRASTGSKRWDKRFDEVLSYAPAVSSTGIAVVTGSGVVYALDSNGNFVSKKGVDLGSSPVASPSFIGKTIAVGADNGTLNIINIQTGDILFNYLVPPLFKGQKSSAPTSGEGGRGAGASGEGGLGSGGSRGKGAGQAAGNETEEIKYVAVAGPAVASGDTMLVLTQDGSMLAFDKKLGVDLTAPSVKMAWPRGGEQISGQPPLELVFLIEDAASGVNADTVKVTINGEAYKSTFTRDGYLSVKVSALGTNRPLMDGRAEVVVTASDWMGNLVSEKISLSVDNTLPPTGSPPANSKAAGAGSGKGSRGGPAGG